MKNYKTIKAEAELHAQLAEIAEAHATLGTECAHMTADRVLVESIVTLAELHYGSVPRVVEEILALNAAMPKWYA